MKNIPQLTPGVVVHLLSLLTGRSEEDLKLLSDQQKGALVRDLGERLVPPQHLSQSPGHVDTP